MIKIVFVDTIAYSENGREKDFSSPIHLLIDSFSTIAKSVYLSGRVAPPPLCSAMALCGRCCVRVITHVPSPCPEDVAFFTEEELAQGLRLGCRHAPELGMIVEVDAKLLPVPSSSRVLSLSDKKRFLAVDLGTTSLQWLSFGDGKIQSGNVLNPQMGAGSDIISRLCVASLPEGKARLSTLVVQELERIINGCNGVSELCIAANTAMTSIVLEKDISSLAVAPYKLTYSGGQFEALPGMPLIWIPPQLSPFVGGDISAGYASLALSNIDKKKNLLGRLAGSMALPFTDTPKVTYPFLLADLGTNGEFLLALSPDTALVTSVALGPALEGIGLTFGTEAREGAVTRYSLTPRGLEPHVYIAENELLEKITPAGTMLKGITGTGYISLVYRLLLAGALTKEGHFTGSGILSKNHHKSTAMRAFHHAQRYEDEPFIELPSRMRFYASDIEEILKVKAAFSLGLQRLLLKAGVAFEQLSAVYLAGALGKYADGTALEALGFFPSGAASQIHTVGNISLLGAALLAGDQDLQTDLIAWSHNVASIDLASDSIFREDFSKYMSFSWQPEWRVT